MCVFVLSFVCSVTKLMYILTYFWYSRTFIIDTLRVTSTFFWVTFKWDTIEKKREHCPLYNGDKELQVLQCYLLLHNTSFQHQHWHVSLCNVKQRAILLLKHTTWNCVEKATSWGSGRSRCGGSLWTHFTIPPQTTTGTMGVWTTAITIQLLCFLTQYKTNHRRDSVLDSSQWVYLRSLKRQSSPWLNYKVYETDTVTLQPWDNGSRVSFLHHAEQQTIFSQLLGLQWILFNFL